MRILVTGREGQLVRSLAEAAAKRGGIEIIAAGRPDLDLELSGSATRAIAAAAPDLVINAAAYTAVDQAEDEPERAFRINGEGAGEVAAAARAAGAPIIHISTDYVFDGASEQPYREDDPTNPLGVYGRSKLEGEDQVRRSNPDHLIVRTAWVYSPFGKNFVKTMMRAAREREVLSVVADQRGSPSSALDLAEGLLAVARRWSADRSAGLGQVYHLAGTGETSWQGFAAYIMKECARLGLPAARVEPIKTADWPTRARRPANSVLDSGKFAHDFGFRMPEWRQSVSQIVSRSEVAA